MDNFEKKLIEEVKSQGVFDEFRFNCCLADVDTKPAYQNVRNRVETAVNDFLSKQQWTPDTNKVQLRERLRKHLLDSDVLDKGVDHIVDQVVNPKVATIFEPKIESIAYKYLGITPPPPPAHPPPRPPLLPAPPLPPYANHTLGHMNGGNMLKVETTASLLPTDLEQISPDSDRATVKSDMKDDTKDEEELPPPGVDDDDLMDDDDTTSPAFERAASIKEDTNNASLNTSDSVKDVKELANDSRDAGASQASQLSQVSSDSRLTIASTDVTQPTSTNIAANISEEAQMPKFNENSNETDGNSGRQLHFDIKQDAITFEGTERRNSMSGSTNGVANTLSIEDAILCELKANISDVNNVSIGTIPESVPEPPPVPVKEEPQAGSNSDLLVDSAANSQTGKEAESLKETPQQSEPQPTVTEQEPQSVKTEEVKPIATENPATPVPTVAVTPRDEIVKSAEVTSPASASSSSLTKKSSHSHHSSSRDKERRHHSSSHSERRKSRERERDKDRDHDKSRSKTSSSSKHSSSSHSSSSKHRSSSSKTEKSSTSTSSSRSNHESSSSKRSSSRHESSSSSSAHKKHKSSSSSSRSDRDRSKSSHSQSRSHNGSGSSSSTSKRSDRDKERDRGKTTSTTNSASNSINNGGTTDAAPIVQDDHNEAKAKPIKRHSHDSNDEGKAPGSNGKSLSETGDSGELKSTATNQNGKEHKSNGTNGNKDNGVSDIADASNVVIVTDMLQQSSTSYIELSVGCAAPEKSKVEADPEHTKIEEKVVTEEKQTDVDKAAEETLDVAIGDAEESQDVLQTTVEDQKPAEALAQPEPPQETISECEENSKDLPATQSDEAPEEHSIDAPKDERPIDPPKDERPIDPPADHCMESAAKHSKKPPAEQSVEAPAEHSVETPAEHSVETPAEHSVETPSEHQIELPTEHPIEQSVEPPAEYPAEPTAEIETFKNAAASESPAKEESDVPTQATESTEVQTMETSEPGTSNEDIVTHLESQDSAEFENRLTLIEQNLKNLRWVLNIFCEVEDSSNTRRSASKRRLSSEEPSSSSTASAPASASKRHSSSSMSSSSSSSSPNGKAKRPRLDATKASPTPSELSVNSKENEELGKHDKGDLSSRRLSNQKWCQQQRYTNDDLYKPRALISQRSRRRGLDAIL